MNPLCRLLFASAFLMAPTVAAAVAIDLGASDLRGNEVADASGAALLSFDVSVNNTQPIDLVVHMSPGESSVAWNGYYVRPTHLEFMGGYEVAVSGATLVQGSVRESLARDVAGVSVTGTDTAEISFAGVESAFAVGAPPGSLPAGASDWQILTVTPGASFTMTLTPMPEPGLGGLGACLWALAALRRRHAGS